MTQGKRMKVNHNKLFQSSLLMAVLLFLLSACGGGGGDGGSTGGSGSSDGTGGSGGTPPPSSPPPASGPAFSGFDFTLAAGNFWEYRWDYYKNSWDQSGGGGTATDTGRFWIQLGSPVQIQGISAYPVTLYGKSGNASKSFAPRWKYLAVNNNQILGSTDGTTLVPIFDAQTGEWPGGGFFSSLPNTLIIAQNGTISPYNNFISGSAIVTGRSASQSQCQYFPGVGTICGDSSYNYQENEYFRSNQGPVGYYYYNTFSDCGGGWCSGATWRHNVGLTASTRTGQANPLVAGRTASNNVSSAMGFTAVHPVIGTIWSTSLVNSNMTTLNVTVVDDNGNTIPNYQPVVEHWYSFSLVSAAKVTITLSFEGSASNTDLDMFLLNSAMTTLYGYSVHNNAARSDQHERIIVQSLPAGTYRIGVDHAGPAAVFPASSPAVKYTLELE